MVKKISDKKAIEATKEGKATEDVNCLNFLNCFGSTHSSTLTTVPSAYNPPWSLLITRAFRRGARSLVRDRGWLPSLLSLTGMAFLFHLILLGGFAGLAVDASLRDAPAFRVPLLSPAAGQLGQNFYSELRAESFIKDAQYVTGDQTLAEQRKTNTALAEFLDRYNLHNPFPDSVVLHLKSLDNLPAFTSFLQSPQWSDVIDPVFLAQISKDELQSADTIAVAHSAQTIAWFALIFASLAILAGTAAFLRSRSLQRRDELILLDLLGERPLPLLVPFMTEVLLLLIIAFCASALLFAFFLVALPIAIPAFAANGPLGSFMALLTEILAQSLPGLLGLHVVFILLLATLSAFFGIKRPSFLQLLHVSH